jgi:hypothetical protein
MTMPAAAPYEPPPLCTLDEHDVDRLLERLRAMHGDRDLQADIAPELLRAAALQGALPRPYTR